MRIALEKRHEKHGVRLESGGNKLRGISNRNE